MKYFSNTKRFKINFEPFTDMISKGLNNIKYSFFIYLFFELPILIYKYLNDERKKSYSKVKNPFLYYPKIILRYLFDKNYRNAVNPKIYLLITRVFTAYAKYYSEKFTDDQKYLDSILSSYFSNLLDVKDSFIASKLINLSCNHGYYINKVLKLYLKNYFFSSKFLNLKISHEVIAYIITSILHNDGNVNRASRIVKIVIKLRCCSEILKDHLKFLECLDDLYSQARSKKKYDNVICVGVTLWHKSYAQKFVDLTLRSLSLNNNLDYLVKKKKKVTLTIVTDNETKVYLNKLINETYKLKSIKIIYFIFDASNIKLLKGNLKLLYWSFLDQVNVVISKKLNSHFFPLTADAVYSPNFIKNTFSQIIRNDFVLTGHALLKDSKKFFFGEASNLSTSNLEFNKNICRSFHDEMNLSIVNYFQNKFIKYPSRIAWLSKNTLIIHYLYTHPAIINKDSLKYIKSCSRFDFKPLYEISKKKNFQFKFISNPEKAFYATFTNDNQKFSTLNNNFSPKQFVKIRLKDSPYNFHWKSFINNKVILKYPNNLNVSVNYDTQIKLIKTTLNKDFYFNEM